MIDEGLEVSLEEGWLEGIAGRVLAAEEVGDNAELGLVIVSQDRMQRLNRDYTGRDEPTDVLAFSMFGATAEAESEDGFPPFVTPPDGVLHLGEVVVSYAQAVEQAAQHQHSVKKEIALLVIHGVLHLLGYDHERPEEEHQMRAREAELLRQVTAE